MDILGKKIAIITAHPDDEAFLAGGTIVLNKKQGGYTSVFCATEGGLGKSHLSEDMSEQDLRQLRKQEIAAASEIMGIHRLKLGEFPDGSLDEGKTQLYEQVEKFISEEKPEVIISFGPDGITGHVDHVAVGEIARQIAGEMGISFVQFSRPPKEISENFYDYFVAKRKMGRYVDIHQIEEPNLRIEVSPDTKLRVLQCYQSQWKGLDPHAFLPENLANHLMANEYFLVSER